MKMTTLTWLALAALAVWLLKSRSSGAAKPATINPKALAAWLPWAPTAPETNADAFAQATNNYNAMLAAANFTKAPPGKSGVTVTSGTIP